MRVFLTVLVLIFSFQFWIKADDIKDFQLEGMSIGDSLLNHFSEEYIKNHSKYWWEDKKYFMVIGASPLFETYEYMQFGLENNDKNFIIQGISGKILFEKDIKNCLKKKDEVVTELSNYFKNDIENIEEEIVEHQYDKSGKSKQYTSYVNLKSKNTIDVYCEDWSEKTELVTNFQVRILNKEFVEYLSTSAYK
jgi:hypothetical protein|tara:strand:- start:77 stop:655 length:579 start_codon:yes stop_codon:yes gene_type:complete